MTPIPYPTITPTVTRTPTQIPTLTTTATSTQIPATLVFPALATPYQYLFDTPTPIALPSMHASDFGLKDWSDQNAIELIQLMGAYAHAADVVGPLETRGDLLLAQKPLKLSVQEALWRFPNSSYRESLEWHLVSPIIILGNQESDQWILSKIEDRLNTGKSDLSNINGFLRNYGLGIADWTSNGSDQTGIPNLFGDGKEAKLLSLYATVEFAGSNELMIAERTNPDKSVSLVPISFFQRNVALSVPQFMDLTNDGIPEIIFSSDVCSGDCNSDRAYIFHWQGDHFVEITNGKIYNHDYDISWEIGSLDNDKNKTILMAYQDESTQKPYIQEVYEWNGINYELASQNVIGQNASEAFFYDLLSKIKTSQSNDLVAFLRKSDIHILGAKSLDLNADGRNDWVLLSDSSAPWALLWVLINNGENYVAINTPIYFQINSSSNMKVDQAELIDGRSVVIVKIGTFAKLFSVLNLKSGTAVLNYDRLTSNNVVNYAFVLVNDMPAIKIFRYYPLLSWDIYQWDETEEQFKAIDTYRTDREQLEYQATQDANLIFSEKRGQAIKSLNQYLSLPKELCSQDNWDCLWKRQNILPPLWYMLGLAYELDGKEDQAVKTYWQLWHDYPDSPYALMAQYKLDPIQH